MSIPPWLSEDFPQGKWHADVSFFMRAYENLEDLVKILHPEPFWEVLTLVIEERCNCGSVDGEDQSDSEEVEETYCPSRSSFQPDSNR